MTNLDELVELKVLSDALTREYKDRLAEWNDEVEATNPASTGEMSSYCKVERRFSKAKPPETVTEFRVTDEDALLADGSEDFAEFLGRWVKAHIGDAAKDYFDEVGELLDGCEMVTETVPGTPPKYIGTWIVPDKAMRKAIIGQFGPQVAGYLGGAK